MTNPESKVELEKLKATLKKEKVRFIRLQFIDIMGSPYLLAHGLGAPVANAKTTVEFPVPERGWSWAPTTTTTTCPSSSPREP